MIALDMISVAHSPKGVAWVDRDWCLNTCEPDTFKHIRPNYPVPALVFSAYMDGGSVTLFNRSERTVARVWS